MKNKTSKLKQNMYIIMLLASLLYCKLINRNRLNYLCGHCLQWIEWVQRQSITHKLLGHLLISLLSIFSQIKIMLNKTWNIALTWLYWSLPDGWCFAHVRMLQLIFLKYILKFIHKLQRHFYYPNIRILLPSHRLFIILRKTVNIHPNKEIEFLPCLLPKEIKVC